MKPQVLFTKEITPESILGLYNAISCPLPGPVAVKVHSGEQGNQNFLQPDLWEQVVKKVNGTVVECNTAYPGARDTTEHHRRLMERHGWSARFPVEILDSEGPDLELSIPEGHQIHKNFVGRRMADYRSILVLSHFKGHPMGGFGGAVKQLSIGFASSYGKKYIHGAGDAQNPWSTEKTRFLEAMADGAYSVSQYFKGRAVYINVMKNMSVDCDCCAVAEDPCMKDIGALVSLDPVAADQACVDFIYASSDPGRNHMVERIESRQGLHTLEAAEALGLGSRQYELVHLDRRDRL